MTSAPTIAVDPMGLAVTVTGPEVEVVSFIADFDPGGVNLDDLLQAWKRVHPSAHVTPGIIHLLAVAVDELSISANPKPPKKLVYTIALGRFRGDERVSRLALGEVCLECENGNWSTYSWTRDWNDGYTPIRGSRNGPTIQYSPGQGQVDPVNNSDTRPSCVTSKLRT